MGLIASGTATIAAPPLGGTLDPTTIPKYVDPLPIPESMPKQDSVDSGLDVYEVAVRQFPQQVLPTGLPATTVWGYGSPAHPASFSYPGRTIEAVVNRPVRVTWLNDLKDATGHFLPHLFAVDQTLHWANPPQECRHGPRRSDCHGRRREPYAGPVPIVTHLHGAHVTPESDGYPEAWYLPAAKNIPAGFATKGAKFAQRRGVSDRAGAAVFQYANDQAAATLWYHDHVLGMTRLNVYAGLAGFYLLRDPTTDPAGLPSGAYEIPLAIQDRSFNRDGSLFFPARRGFFEAPAAADAGDDDVRPPIWNPEFFGNTIVVNGKTWPMLAVEPRRYRFRILNGSDARVLRLKIATDPVARPAVAAVPFWQIGGDGGFLPKPVRLDELLIAPAERVDVIADLSGISVGATLHLINEGPDKPFGAADLPVADPGTTGQVMRLTVRARAADDRSTAPEALTLPRRARLGRPARVRALSLNEKGEMMLGTARVSNGVVTPMRKEWSAAMSETPTRGGTELWELYNFTEDAHPIHLHLVQFEVVNRQKLAIDAKMGSARLVRGTVTPPRPGETGTKDTVLAEAGMVTRVKARFDVPGLFVWHCHILSHEDNEMMRAYCVGDPKSCAMTVGREQSSSMSSRSSGPARGRDVS
jgi:bilirubin oxidase